MKKQRKLQLIALIIGVLTYGVFAYASSTTTNYSLTKPSLGDSNWHTSLNANFDTIDSSLYSVESEVVNARKGETDLEATIDGIISDFQVEHNADGTHASALSTSAWTSGPDGTYATGTTFTVSGDYTGVYTANRQLRLYSDSINYVSAYVFSSNYSAPDTTVTVAGAAVPNPMYAGTPNNKYALTESATIPHGVVTESDLANTVYTTGITRRVPILFANFDISYAPEEEQLATGGTYLAIPAVTFLNAAQSRAHFDIPVERDCDTTADIVVTFVLAGSTGSATDVDFEWEYAGIADTGGDATPAAVDGSGSTDKTMSGTADLTVTYTITISAADISSDMGFIVTLARLASDAYGGDVRIVRAYYEYTIGVLN